MDEDEDQVAPRFDAAIHTSYDESDLEAIRQNSSALFPDANREDVGENSIYLARQLDYVKARTYEKRYPEMKGGLLVPTATDTPQHAETITWRMYDQVGMAKIIANYADDLPRADVRAQEKTVRVRDIGDSYGYNVNELAASRALGTGLDVRKAGAARMAIEQKVNRIVLRGDEDFGLMGFLNHPNIGEVVGLHGDWVNPATTGDMILEDLNLMVVALIEQSHGVHAPNFLALPPAPHAAASTRRLGDTTETALGFFKRMYPGVQVESVYECRNADETTGQDIVLLYERSEENGAAELVMPFSQLPPQARNLEFVVPCLSRHAGVHIRYPLAYIKGVGI